MSEQVVNSNQVDPSLYTGQGAQEAFTNGGEAGYQDYIKRIQAEGAQEAFAIGGEAGFRQHAHEQQYGPSRQNGNAPGTAADKISDTAPASTPTPSRRTHQRIVEMPAIVNPKPGDDTRGKEIATRHNEVDRSPLSPEVIKLQDELNNSRIEYARVIAERSNRAWVFGKRKRHEDRKSLIKARIIYTIARDELGAITAALYKQAGTPEEAFDLIASMGAVTECKSLASELSIQQAVATGRYKRKDDGSLEELKARGGLVGEKLGKARDAWYNFYARHSVGTTRKEKVQDFLWKYGTMTAGGAIVGLGAALLAAELVPAVAGGVAGTSLVLASRTMRAWMVAKTSKGSQNTVYLMQHRKQALLDAMQSDILRLTGRNGEGKGDAQKAARKLNTRDLTRAVEEQMRGEIRANRIRHIGAVASTLAGVGLGNLAANHSPILEAFSTRHHNLVFNSHGGVKSGTHNVSHGGVKSGTTGGNNNDRLGFGNHPGTRANPSTPSHSGSPDVNITGSKYEYPWDWAEQRWGADRATPELLKLVSRARAAGLDVDINPVDRGKYFDISVAGKTATGYVISTLSKYI